MALDMAELDDKVLTFLSESHLATLTLVRPNGTPHVTPVGFSYDPESKVARIITWTGSHKYRIASAPGGVPAALSQVDGGRWLTLEGIAAATTNESNVVPAVEGYAARYHQPGDRDDRAAIDLTVSRILGRG